MNSRVTLKRYTALKVSMFVAILVVIAVTVVVQYFVWLPDVFTRSEVRVGRMVLPGTGEFTVTQQWNGFDLYSTYLVLITTKGKTARYVLDGDDIKRWRCSFKLKQPANHLAVVFGNREIASYSPNEDILINQHNEKVRVYSTE